MGLLDRRVRVGVVALAGAGLVALTGAFGVGPASAVSSTTALATIRGSLPSTTDQVTGMYQSSRMTVEVALAPSHSAALGAQLTAVYDRNSSQYQHWLPKGAFDATYAPSTATTASVGAYLRASGLTVGRGSSPFVITATGSSARVATAFHTTLSTYSNPRGVGYYSNSAPVRMPSVVSAGVLGVVGLSDTVRAQSMIARAKGAVYAKATTATTRPGVYTPGSCEAPYVTRAQLFDVTNNGVGFPFGYGRAPGCTGLTPSQTNSIYGAPRLGAKARGRGVDLAVFELSAYQASDVAKWAHTFYGPHYRPPLVDVTVDGGPLHPVCPVGDTCPPSLEYYAGDDEAAADIEMQLAVSPDARSIIVYNAPNDFSGQTELDEYSRIAAADAASVISSSWGGCENDVTAGFAQAENVVFEQMALQGQSMFASAGDSGAFSCIRSDGTPIVNVFNPASQPWVTSVGGTSLRSNPGVVAHPAYTTGAETVWNVDGLCNSRGANAAEGYHTGLFWCNATGAGGGGSSQYWGRPAYQHGPGVDNVHTTHANGTTDCSVAATGTPCREVPDISANADEYTPYAVYCSGNTRTPNSACATIPTRAAGRWFGLGGTSLSSPVWSAIIANRDSYRGRRSGNINTLLYGLLAHHPGRYFHDITGKGRATNNNGLFPVTVGYDEATGIGTPEMAALITFKY